MPHAARGDSSACEGFRKRSANAIEFGGFTQRPWAFADKNGESAKRNGETGLRLVRARAEGLELTLDLGERARELLATCGVCRGLKLTAEFGISQTERFCAPQL